MAELWIAVGLMLAAEGLLYGGFPKLAKRIAETVLAMPEAHLRLAGVASIALGVVVVWLARG
ncbi:MAG: DUF2065 family protein [Rhizobiaceae bacterium]|nr:DUF2065 family protein [Rhizobiaceae bacterium]